MTRDPSTRHFAAIGSFIHGCSSIEGDLADLLRDATGIKESEIARAIIGVGDLRVKDYITIIKRVAKIRNFKTKELDYLDRLLQWVTYFNDVRQVIAHKPCHAYDRDWMRFFNHYTAKSLKTQWSYHCSIQQLKKASALMREVGVGLTTVQMQLVGAEF